MHAARGPRVNTSLESSSPRKNSLRVRLAMTTALAGILFSYGGRQVYAGTCTGGGGIYSCSGAANPVTDVTQMLNSGGPLTVTTTAGFGIDTTAGVFTNAIELTGSSGISFTDNNSAAISGSGYGIYALNSGTGSIAITTTGTVTGTGTFAIYADNSATGSLAINAHKISGLRGIYADNSGTGTTNVNVTGTVNTTDFGIYVDNSNTSGDITISTGAITSGDDSIGVDHRGGTANITVTGSINSGNHGIYVDQGSTAGDLTISTQAVTAADDYGIRVDSAASAVNITATGTVSADFAAISVDTRSTNSSAITINAASATGSEYGVYIRQDGTGDVAVTATGAVSGGTAGIYAMMDSTATGTVSVTVSGSVSSSSGNGIHIDQDAGYSNTQTINLNSGAAVSGNNAAILTTNGNATVTVNSGASVTGGIQLGANNDHIIFDGGDFSAVTLLDGGDDASSADGQIDTLTFRNVSGSVAGNIIQNMERTVVDAGAKMSITGTVTTEKLSVSNGGELGGSLTLNGDLIVDTGVLKIAAGDIINVSGLLEIGAGATVEFDFDSFGPGPIDVASFFTGTAPNFLAGFLSTNFLLITENAGSVGQLLEFGFGGDSVFLTAQLEGGGGGSPVSEPAGALVLGA